MLQARGDTARRNAPIEVIRRGRTHAAEVRGVDFSRPIDQVTAELVNEALVEHKVIYFRNADMTPEQQVSFGRLFGELTVHPFSPHYDGIPELTILDNHKDNPVFSTDHWHSDESFRATPPLGTVLRCIRTPETGGNTLWADMAAAYERLSDKMQHFVSGLEAVHDFNPFRRKFDHLPPAERHQRLAEMEEKFPKMTHPVVRTHPVSGKKVLFVNEQFTIAIKDMRADESRTLLDFLNEQPRIPELQFRFQWEPNLMVVWDNRSTQHYAANDYYPERRTMHRLTIKGDRPM